MSLSALPTVLLVPPANLLLPACLGAAWHRRRAGRWLLAASLAGLVILSIPAVSKTLIASLECCLPLAPEAAHPPGAIVILSGDEDRITRNGETTYDVGLLTLARERAGAALARKMGLPVLLSGGHIRPDAPALADMMASSMRDDFALPAKWLETRSVDTWQNAEFSAAILKADHVGSVYVVSDAWHLRRALIAFRHAGLYATAAPVLLDAPVQLKLDTLLPDTKAWEYSYFAFHEWIGCGWYALRAWH